MSLTGSSEAEAAQVLEVFLAFATSELLAAAEDEAEAIDGFWCFSTTVALPFFSVLPFLCLKVSAEAPAAEAWFKFVVDPNSATGAE